MACPAPMAAAPTAIGAATADPAAAPPAPDALAPSSPSDPALLGAPVGAESRLIIRVLEYVETPVCAARAGPREIPWARSAPSATGISFRTMNGENAARPRRTAPTSRVPSPAPAAAGADAPAPVEPAP